MRKHGARLKEPVREEILEATKRLEEARRSKDADAGRGRLEKLDRLLDKHLSFGRKSAFREYVESIGVAVIIALFLRAFVVEAFKIPSGSMIPTLKVGDHLFVSKFIYGIRIPFTRIKFFTRSPKHGDVIVFIFPGDESKDFIKRVVAIGGDRVAVRNDVITVNGKKVMQRRLGKVPCRYRDKDEHGMFSPIKSCVALEEQHGENTYRVIHDAIGPAMPDMAEALIPKGQVFVMGDNRHNSHDGRAWGTVPLENIKGKALIVWWSSDPDGIRWSRFFELVHGYDVDVRNRSIHDGLAPDEFP
ncbi:MAG: signal peptidase I [Deltaproteobacteria bacterium]|nr:signal peptidase I [Deltaproteobacteria bacterium]